MKIDNTFMTNCECYCQCTNRLVLSLVSLGFGVDGLGQLSLVLDGLGGSNDGSLGIGSVSGNFLLLQFRNSTHSSEFNQ